MLLYVAWWILPGSIHYFFMLKTTTLSSINLFLDSLVSFGSFALLGLPLWFTVRYGGFNDGVVKINLRNQLISMFVFFLLWGAISYGLLNLLIDDFANVFYTSLLWRSLLFIPVYLIIVTMYYLLSSMQIMNDQELQRANLEMLIKEAELNALKSQINPHFLFNSLNSAAALTISNSEAAREMIVKISEFFRFNLLAGKKQFVSLRQEIEQSLLYLEIEKGRFGDKMLVNCDLPTDFEDIMLPSLILQPIVENCVKHGVYESTSTVNIDFQFNLEDGFLKIKIVNGIEQGSGRSKKGTGTGLKNIAERLKLTYASENMVEVEKTNIDYSVTIRIPVS